MGLFLPILLLGLAQPADQQLILPTSQPEAQVSSTNKQLPAPQVLHDRPFDRIEPKRDCQGDADCKALEGPPVCLTMRSYYFERRDSLAPEPAGYSTCESTSTIRNRNAKKRHQAGLVPAGVNAR
jgi:hypothetical protein